MIVNASESEDFITKSGFNEIIKYFSGHIPGFYMAEVIKRNGMEQQLVDPCEDPFSIFKLYNRAAKKDDAKPILFSPEAMDYLNELEKKAFEQAS